MVSRCVKAWSFAVALSACSSNNDFPASSSSGTSSSSSSTSGAASTATGSTGTSSTAAGTTSVTTSVTTSITTSTTSTSGTSTGSVTTSATSSGGSTSSGDGGLNSPAQAIAAYAQAYCTIQQQCFGIAAIDVSPCEQFVIQGNTLAEATVLLDAGLMGYDPVQAQACLAAMNAQGCDFFLDPSGPAACTNMLPGQIPTGSVCQYNPFSPSGCIPDDYCVNSFEGVCVPSVCTPYAEALEPCDSPTAFCDPLSGTYCTGGASSGLSDGGELCAFPSGDGGGCSMGGECQPGLYCESLPGVCLPVAPNDPCSDTGACPLGLTCLSETCITSVQDGGVCGTNLTAVEENQQQQECADGLLCAGMTAGFDDGGNFTELTAGNCMPPAQVGATCVTGPDGGLSISGCAVGLNCVGGVCQPAPLSGPCYPMQNQRFAWPCQSFDHYCNTDGTCQPVGSLGADCDPNQGGQDCFSAYCDASNHCGITQTCADAG